MGQGSVDPGAASSAAQRAGRVTHPAMGRSSGPNGPAPSSARSRLCSLSGSLTPTSAPKRPMNMLPFTKAPSLYPVSRSGHASYPRSDRAARARATTSTGAFGGVSNCRTSVNPASTRPAINRSGAIAAPGKRGPPHAQSHRQGVAFHPIHRDQDPAARAQRPLESGKGGPHRRVGYERRGQPAQVVGVDVVQLGHIQRPQLDAIRQAPFGQLRPGQVERPAARRGRPRRARGTRGTWPSPAHRPRPPHRGSRRPAGAAVPPGRPGREGRTRPAAGPVPSTHGPGPAGIRRPAHPNPWRRRR